MKVPTTVRPEQFIEAAEALGRHGWAIGATELYDAVVAWDARKRAEGLAMLKTGEVARRLGLSPQFVRRMCADGRLPSVRFGKQVRVPRAALEEAVRAAGAPTTGK